MRATLLMIAFLLSCGFNAAAQKNLVRNGDFETYSSCPTDNDQINKANYWTAIDSVGFGIYSCIPDYCHACATSPNTTNTVPASTAYWQQPHSGSGMAQVIMFADEPNPGRLRDYLQGRLLRTLTGGKSYCVSFYVCLSEASTWAIKEISGYLDNGTIDTTGTCWLPQAQYSPQVTNNSGIIRDTMHWTRIEGAFVASGKERFITIGNFKSKAGTTYDMMAMNSYNVNFPDRGSGYLVDDVSVVETGTPADAGPDKHIGSGDRVYIGLPSSEVIWNSWRVLGDTTVIGEGPGIWVKPKVTTSYVVTQTLCGTTTKDTVKVEVWAAGVSSINGQTQEYSLAPNPTGGIMQVAQSIPSDEQAEATIINVLGQRGLASAIIFSRGKTVLDLHGLAPGIYYLSLKDHKGYVWNLRFVKQ